MQQLTGKSEEEIFSDLQNVIFLNPEYEEGKTAEKYLTADEYLSGNVREKLAFARIKAQEAFKPMFPHWNRYSPKTLRQAKFP